MNAAEKQRRLHFSLHFFENVNENEPDVGDQVMSFAQRLTKHRQSLGWTQQQLATAVGVSATCVWNWEKGNTFPRQESVRRIAKRLGVEPAELVGDYTTPSERAALEHPRREPSTEPQTVDAVLDRAKEEISRLLKLPKERIQLLFSVSA